MLMTLEKALLLREVRIFADTPDHTLSGVAGIMSEIVVAPNETVIEEGEWGTSMYVVVDGMVRVQVGGKTVAELGEGQVFGELAALDPEPRIATIVAGTKEVHLLRLEREDLFDLMTEQIEVAYGIVRFLCGRYRELSRHSTSKN
jgi:CRP-like cAMP-binding protein